MSFDSKEPLIQEFLKKLVSGENFARITEARKLAEEILGQRIPPGDPLTKVVDEAMEAAVVRAAPDLIGRVGTVHEAYDCMVDLLNRQPTLAVRSTTSMLQQAYSTPVPIAYLTSRLAGITQETTVYEPTAGNGALLIDAHPANVIANEFNSDRFAELSTRGFQHLTQHDATEFTPDTQVDVVVTNPPFGSIRDQPGKRKWFELDGNKRGTNQVDHAIAMKALRVIRDGGRAVLILGGKQGRHESWRSDQYNGIVTAGFYYALYHQYNVIDHFSIWGDLYRKQGAGFPIDVVVIDGRGKSARSLPAVDVPRIYTSFEALKELMPDVPLTHAGSVQNVPVNLESATGYGGGAVPGQASRFERNEVVRLPEPDGTSSRLLDSGLGEPGRITEGYPPNADQGTTEPFSNSGGTESGRAVELGNPVGDGTRSAQSSTRSANGGGIELPGIPHNDYPSRPPDGGNLDAPSRTGDARRLATATDPGGVMPDSTPIIEDELLVPTPVLSQGTSLSTLTPKNLAEPYRNALVWLNYQVGGNVDEYVRKRLGYASVEEMWGKGGSRLCAEQIDAAAFGMVQRDLGFTFLNADQTGNGKGRWCGTQIVDAIQRGVPAVWVMERPDMYTTGLRDLRDLDVEKLLGRPLSVFVTNASQKILMPDASQIRTGTTKQQNEEMRRIVAGEAHYDLILTTYSQMQPVGGGETERREFLREIAPQSAFIFDEAHNASGSTIGADSDNARSLFVRKLVDKAKEVVFASATPTKDPAVVDLYARRTGIDKFSSIATLMNALYDGGLAMQQAFASDLAKSGLMARRERSYDGIEVRIETLPVDRAAADTFSACMSAIARFDLEKEVAIELLNEALKANAKKVWGDNAVGQTGAESTNFTSLMHNVVDQFGLSIKADQVAGQAIALHRQGIKPVIGFISTMETHLDSYAQDQGIRPGDVLDISYADILMHYLERSRDIWDRDHQGKRERRPLTDDELGTKGIAAYEEAKRLIDESREILSSVPISFVDKVRQRLKDAGMTSGEITGRTARVDYSGTLPRFSSRSTSERSTQAKVETVDRFNSGSVDTILINKAGFSGINLQASSQFVNQSQRCFISCQFDNDINAVMQSFGRVNRFGQVVPPIILIAVSDLPAERRTSALVADRLAKLNANTTANRDSSLSIRTSQFFSAYGEAAVELILKENPEIDKKLSFPTQSVREGDLALIRRTTGRMPLMSTAEQEELYELIDTEVAVLIEQDRIMGIDPEAAKQLDLDAQVLARTELIPASQIGSNFGGAVYAEVVSTKPQVQPMKRREIINAARETLGLQSVLNPSELHIDEMSAPAQNWTQQKQDSIRALHLTAEQDVVSRFSGGDLAAAIKRLTAQKAHLTNVVTRFPPGSTVEVHYPGVKHTYGVILDVKQIGHKGNPLAPSNWVAEIAMLDHVRVLPLRLSNFNRGVPRHVVGIAPVVETKAGIGVYEAFDQIDSMQLEERCIMRGNLLKAYEKYNRFGSQITYYTTQGGGRQHGLVMPAGFDLQKEIDSTPARFYTTDSIKQFFEATSHKGKVQVVDCGLSVMPSPEHQGGLLLIADLNNGGGAYARNATFVALVGQDFYSVSDRMEATVQPEKVDDVLHYLVGNWRGVVAEDHIDIARQVLGQRLPELEWLDAAKEEALEKPQPDEVVPGQQTVTVEAETIQLDSQAESDQHSPVSAEAIAPEREEPQNQLQTPVATSSIATRIGKLTLEVFEQDDGYLRLEFKGKTANWAEYPSTHRTEFVPVDELAEMAGLSNLAEYAEFAVQQVHSDFEQRLGDEADRITLDFRRWLRQNSALTFEDAATFLEVYPEKERIGLTSEFMQLAIKAVFQQEVKEAAPTPAALGEQTQKSLIQPIVQVGDRQPGQEPAASEPVEQNMETTQKLPIAHWDEQDTWAAESAARLLYRSAMLDRMMAGDRFQLEVRNYPFPPLHIDREGDRLSLTQYVLEGDDRTIERHAVFQIDADGLLETVDAVVLDSSERDVDELAKQFCNELLAEQYESAIQKSWEEQQQIDQGSIFELAPSSVVEEAPQTSVVAAAYPPELQAVAPPKEQRGNPEKNVARLLHNAGIAQAVMQGEDFHLRVENQPYIPLVVERHGDRLYLAHYLERNGDTFLDAEMVFSVSGIGQINLLETATQNPLSDGESRGCDRSFANVFSRNLSQQGFSEAAIIAWSKEQEPVQVAPSVPTLVVNVPTIEGSQPDVVDSVPAIVDAVPPETHQEEATAPPHLTIVPAPEPGFNDQGRQSLDGWSADQSFLQFAGGSAMLEPEETEAIQQAMQQPEADARAVFAAIASDIVPPNQVNSFLEALMTEYKSIQDSSAMLPVQADSPLAETPPQSVEALQTLYPDYQFRQEALGYGRYKPIYLNVQDPDGSFVGSSNLTESGLKYACGEMMRLIQTHEQKRQSPLMVELRSEFPGLRFNTGIGGRGELIRAHNKTTGERVSSGLLTDDQHNPAEQQIEAFKARLREAGYSVDTHRPETSTIGAGVVYEISPDGSRTTYKGLDPSHPEYPRPLPTLSQQVETVQNPENSTTQQGEDAAYILKVAAIGYAFKGNQREILPNSQGDWIATGNKYDLIYSPDSQVFTVQGKETQLKIQSESGNLNPQIIEALESVDIENYRRTEEIFSRHQVVYDQSPAEVQEDARQWLETLEELREWYREATDLSKSERYLGRIKEVGEAFKRGEPLTEQVLAAIESDRKQWQQLNNPREFAQMQA